MLDPLLAADESVQEDHSQKERLFLLVSFDWRLIGETVGFGVFLERINYG